MTKSLYSGSQVIDDTSSRSLEAVLLNELNLKFISAINQSTNVIVRALR